MSKGKPTIVDQTEGRLLEMLDTHSIPRAKPENIRAAAHVIAMYTSILEAGVMAKRFDGKWGAEDDKKLSELRRLSRDEIAGSVAHIAQLNEDCPAVGFGIEIPTSPEHPLIIAVVDWRGVREWLF